MNLRGLIGKSVTIEVDDVSPELFEAVTGYPLSDAEIVAEVYSLAASAGLKPGKVTIQAALYQDDDAHDTCSLTACLNPLHPGPCKGWKGTLFDAAPGAFHALEKAKADKANAARIKKIEALKSAGKPIPKKLLVEIKPKAHPHEGQTAKSATGEAHAAGKAISQSSGITNNHPGKVSLGMAVKKPVELGPKGKKPTVASKGIAHVIGQEKVTPQYKLDKAAAITPEQWAGLSDADKASIRDELTKIKKDGFGPQQKKADELLAKLSAKPEPAAPDPDLKAKLAKQMSRAAEDTAKGREHIETEKAKLGEAVKQAAPKPLPKHVQAAVDMANGHAPGASWSKNHLAAYQPLTAEEFHGLPPETQAKITSELTKAQTKFLDPKKVQASKDLLAKFGKGPSTPNVDKAPKPVASEKTVGFSTHLHDHNVTQAQAKQAVESVPAAHHFLAAKQTAGLVSEDNPDSAHFKQAAADKADTFVGHLTAGYDKAVVNDPIAKDAADHLWKVTQKFKQAQAVHKAKQDAFNKIGMKLAMDDGKLSPIEKASLEHYQKYLLGHDSPGKAEIDKLQHDVAVGVGDLDEALQSAKKKLTAPKPSEMSAAQLTDRVAKLLGPEAVDSKNLKIGSEADIKAIKGQAEAALKDATKGIPLELLLDPTVAAKVETLKHAFLNEKTLEVQKAKVSAHLKEHHVASLGGYDKAGNKLTTADDEAVFLHAKQLKAQFNPSPAEVEKYADEVDAAEVALGAAIDKAKGAAIVHEPVKLTDFDEATITQAFSAAFAQHANKAVLYGLKNFTQQQVMKSHQDYPKLSEDLGKLKGLAGKVALAHARERTAELNVPTDPDTGAMEHGPEHKAWLAAMNEREELESQFNILHKQAQGRLDTVRTAAGLKKRAIPKLNSTAVKGTAAESGFYKSGSHSGPNYSKPTAAKNYMLAKVGSKLGVVHVTAEDKKAEKLGSTVTPAKTPKAHTGEPVKLGDNSSVAHVPGPLKDQITADFKAAPSGKYLADPTEDIFDNLVTLAAAHGKTVPDGLSVDQVLKTIDETHSKNLGVANSGMLHKKVTDWLGTAAGKEYAEKHSVPDPKKVKVLSGELDLPEGVTLAPGEKVQKLAGPGPHDTGLHGGAFKPLTASQAQAAQDAWMKENGVKWSAQQRTALKSYTGNAYQEYNAYLRGAGSGGGKVKQHVVDIQSAMMPLPQHTLLKRGTGWPPELAKYKSSPEELLGKTFEDKAFVSSTVAGSSGHFSGQPLQLVIEAPEGTPAAFVNGLSHYKDSENEMLLAAGTKFKVLSVEKTTSGHTLMRVRIVGDK